MIGATPQVDVPIKSQRFSQLPCPGTDGKFPTTTREGGEWWRHPIAGTEGVSGRMAALPCPGCEGVAAEAACAGLGAVDAGSAGSAGSAERLCLRLLVGVLIPSSRRGSIALRRDKQEDFRSRPTTTQHGLTRPVVRLRGGEAPKENDTAGATAWNMNIFGWNSESESDMKDREESIRKRQQDMEDSEAREELRKAREDRLERELEETGATENEQQVESGGILDSLLSAGGSVHRSAENKRLWLDVVEGAMGGLSLIMVSLQPLWHSLRGMFGLSLLFYGEEFATLAFHIIVFRLSGWKKAAKSKNELVAYYKKARQTMSKAAKDVRASAVLMAKKDRMLARKEEMMAEKKKLLKMGHVTPKEARAFIDKYRHDIEIIAREQEALATASSSVLAIKGALSFKKLAASVNGLYSAVVTSITASTFKRAGQLTLALTCGGLIKRTLFDLLGPIIDPIGYQIELESYVANIMRGPANIYVGLVGYTAAALMFFHFFVDPHKALTITFVLLGARVVTDYIVAALNPVRWRFGMSKKIDNMPLSALIYLTLATLGFVFHGDAGAVGDYACRPYIAFLGVLNNLLNRFQISTISYFS